MVLDTTSKIGFRHESTPGTDPISSADTDPNDRYWRFGRFTHDINNLIPIETHEWEPIYKANARNPSDSQLSRTHVSNGVAYYPVNLVPYQMIMGNATSHSATVGANNVHTINNINSGSLDTFTVRSEMTGGTDDKYSSSTNCKAQSLSGLINMMGDWKVLSHTLSYNAIKTDTPTLNSAHDGLKYPTGDATMTGTETDTLFKYDTNSAFTWDGDPFINEMALFDYMIINNHTLKYAENTAQLDAIHEGNYQYLFSGSFWRGDCSEFYTDYLAETQKTMVFTLYAEATNYVTLTWSNTTLLQVDAPYASGDNKKFWNIRGYAEDLTITGIDGLADTAAQNEFYGESL